MASLEYEKANPSVRIQFDYLENEEFKANLPTLLQSNDRPSVFHSWGGGVMLEQIQAGFCQDISNAIAGDFKDSFYPAGVQAFMSEGKSYGLPDSAGPIVFWYNIVVVLFGWPEEKLARFTLPLRFSPHKGKTAGVRTERTFKNVLQSLERTRRR